MASANLLHHIKAIVKDHGDLTRAEANSLLGLYTELEAERDRLKAELADTNLAFEHANEVVGKYQADEAEAMKVLQPNMPESGLVDACRQVKQAAITHADNSEKLVQDSKHLRELLWLRHGCPSYALYGDDGEMQCGKCLVDFRRDSGVAIAERFRRIGMAKLDKEGK